MNPAKITKLSTATRLSLLAIVILVGAVFFTVNTALQQQTGSGHAWYTSQSAKAACANLGTTINVSFTNTETSNIYAMNVVAQDITTGQSVNLGTVDAQQTKTGIIKTTRSSLPNGGVIFKLSWASTWLGSGTDQRTASYTGITCTQPSGLAVVAPTCIAPNYAGSGLKILWSETAVVAVDISSTSDFATFYNRGVGGTTSTTGPSGFALHGGSTPLTLDPGTTYYVRTWDQTSHSPTLTFSIPACQQPTPTPACPPPPTCYQNGVMICALPIGSWCGYPTPTPVPTTRPTPTQIPTPTVVPTAIPTEVPQPTDTPEPNDTVINFTVALHGIGTGGDSANPGSQGNMSPLHPDRTINVDIYDVQNQLVTSEPGTITYNASSGKFNGSVDLGKQFVTGLYTVKVKSDQYLRAIVPGIQTITAGQTKTLPGVTLVTGDINGDNAINIVDYNILIGCYSDLLPAVDCSDQNNGLSDITDDGHVNQFDYNLFLRELTNIGGQ